MKNKRLIVIAILLILGIAVLIYMNSGKGSDSGKDSTESITTESPAEDKTAASNPDTDNEKQTEDEVPEESDGTESSIQMGEDFVIELEDGQGTDEIK